MGQITSLAETCQKALINRLPRAIPGFMARKPQEELACAIANTLENTSLLVAEAGTGTGKTFAYLLPCILSGKKTLISTATKTLQDQLFQKDLPTLIQALGASLRIHNLKGRANYICQHRVLTHTETDYFPTPHLQSQLLQVREKLSQMQTGDRSELPEIKEDSGVWYYITSTSDNCLGAECPQYDNCFLVKSRKKAMTADIVVINHHLFFADSRLKQEGLGELLPGMDIVVFDEAHQLPEIATQFFGQRVSTKQWTDLMEELILNWPVIDLPNQPFKALSHQLSEAADALILSLTAHEDKLSFETIQSKPDFTKACQQWLALQETIMQHLKENEEQIKQIPALLQCKERLEILSHLISSFITPKIKTIRWLERFKQTLVFHATPYTIAEPFSKLLQKEKTAYVFTSATLTMNTSFQWFCEELGLFEPQTLLLESPFHFQEQALLYLPRSLPDPKDPHYYAALVERARPIIEAFEGRCFFLFTSHRALQLVAQLLKGSLSYPLLIQNDEPKSILLARFKKLGNAVLLGTATFWEGVDVQGAALSCVIIDKIPFASPFDPITQGRLQYLKEQGLSGFDHLSLPAAVIALKQGVGRLIRDNNDKGILMIADPRLTARDYGRTILSSLPMMPKTRNEACALQFIKGLQLEHETAST